MKNRNLKKTQFQLFRTLIAVLFVTGFFNVSLAQGDRDITGSVTDSLSQEPLVGVNILNRSTSTGSVTDVDGNFSMEGDIGDVLVFSYIGYQSVEKQIASSDPLIVSMQSGAQSLEELVVTGYSVEKKKDIIGSVSVVDMEATKSLPTGSSMQALQGQASGVNIIGSGVPGGASKVFIRGISSFGNTNPLVLIDGVEGSLENLNINDIESMQILKDAGAASIYGVRGANGVVVVTTKKGKSGPAKIGYEAYIGLQLPLSGNPFNLLNSEDYSRLTKIANPNSILFANGLSDFTFAGPGVAGTANQGDPAVDPEKYNFEFNNPANNYIIQKVNKEGTDWFHEIFKPALMTSHNLSFSGGNSSGNYYLSLGYFDQEGTLIETYLKRYSLKVNTNFNIKDRFRVGQNLYAFYNKSPNFSNLAQFGNISNTYRMMPIVPVYDIMGNYAGSFGGTELGSDPNPVAVQERTRNNRDHSWNLVGNVFFEWDIIDRITLRTSFGGNLVNNYYQSFVFTPYERREGNTNPNRYSEGAGYQGNLISTTTLRYDPEISTNHTVGVLIGTEAIQTTGRSVGGNARNYYSTDYEYLVLGNGEILSNSSSGYNYSLVSFFGKLDYGYLDKYLFNITVRRDGSSRFGEENRFGVFPSVSAGWRLSQESFLNQINWLSDLKLRGSYGILGSQHNVSPDNAFSLYSSSISRSYYDIKGTSNSVVSGFYKSRNGNIFTGWEENVVTNVGLDASLFNYQFDISIEYYNKSINGLLFSEPLPATVGDAAAPVINIGDIRNNGLDLSLGWRDELMSNLSYSIQTNITSYNNEIVSIPDPGYFDVGSHNSLAQIVRNQEGHEVSSFFGYKVLGLFQSDTEVENSPVQDGAAPGRFKYEDINGDGTINDQDRSIIGSPNPDFTYGFNLGIDYKGFDLMAVFYGSQGNEILNTITQYTHFYGSPPGNKSNVLLNAWTPENTNTSVPKIEAASSFSTNGVVNSYLLENGSFLKLKSLILGYTLPKNQSTSEFRFYVQASNVFTFTKYTGLDPELGGSSSQFGVDYGNYPNNQTILLFGLNLSF